MSEILAARDPLGARRVLFDPDGLTHAASLAALLARVPEARRAGLDAVGVASAWGHTDAPTRTCLRGVRAVPPGGALVRDSDGRLAATTAGRESTLSSTPASTPSMLDTSDDALARILVSAAQGMLSTARRPLVALGGGLDGPLAVMAARRAGIDLAEAITVTMPGTAYDEAASARATARALKLSLEEVRITPEDLALELPQAVRQAETPLYNLHPVSRSVVAAAAAARGHDALVTGDGADQAAAGAKGPADYVPIVAALTRAAGLSLAAPFVDAAVVASLAASPDQAKTRLRRLARAWGLPADLAERAKVPRFAPALPRSAYPTAPVIERLSRALQRPLTWSPDDRLNVGIASLVHFVSAFELDIEIGV
jgi:asparagine synthase (glutamine-hydrolysing)